MAQPKSASAITLMMTIDSDTMPSFEGEYPQAASLLAMMNEKPLPNIAPDTLEGIGLEALAGDQAATKAQQVLDEVNGALASKDVDRLADCFFKEQSYWRDQLAFTWHLRTFYTPGACASSLVETASLRGIGKTFVLDGRPQFIPASPTLVSNSSFLSIAVLTRFMRESSNSSTASSHLVRPRQPPPAGAV